MPQYVPISGSFGGRPVGRPVPLRRAGAGRYVGPGVRISEGPSRLSFDPRDIVDWIPTHGQIYGPNVGAAGVMYNGHPLQAPRAPAGHPAAAAPSPGLPPALHPGVRFFTRKEQVLSQLQVGQALHFQSGRGYYAWPPVTPHPVQGIQPVPAGGWDTSPAPPGGWRM